MTTVEPSMVGFETTSRPVSGANKISAPAGNCERKATAEAQAYAAAFELKATDAITALVVAWQQEAGSDTGSHHPPLGGLGWCGVGPFGGRSGRTFFQRAPGAAPRGRFFTS